jgi:hypothetical protein
MQREEEKVLQCPKNVGRMSLWRTIQVLEELVLPELKSRINIITQLIGERERESHFRLKRFKTIQHKKGHDVYEDLCRISP